MLIVRGVLSAAMLVIGAIVVVEMLRYPLAQSFTGIVLGGAMMLLGGLRLRQIRGAMRGR